MNYSFEVSESSNPWKHKKCTFLLCKLLKLVNVLQQFVAARSIKTVSSVVSNRLYMTHLRPLFCNWPNFFEANKKMIDNPKKQMKFRGRDDAEHSGVVFFWKYWFID
jgi:hypothetical protein